MIPCLFHCPRGALKNEFRPVVSYYLDNCEMPTSQTVEVITYNNSKIRFALEIQADRLNLKLHVVAREFRPWTWVAKITEPKRLLETFPSLDRIIMLADGNDTIFTRPPYINQVESVLKHYGSPLVLFCPTGVNWPPDERCGLFESSLSTSSKPFLSAGAYVGTIAGILQGMEWIEERRKNGWFKFRGRFSDQLAWRQAHQALYSKFRIDTEGLLFNRFDQKFLSSVAMEMPWNRRTTINSAHEPKTITKVILQNGDRLR